MWDVPLCSGSVVLTVVGPCHYHVSFSGALYPCCFLLSVAVHGFLVSTLCQVLRWCLAGLHVSLVAVLGFARSLFVRVTVPWRESLSLVCSFTASFRIACHSSLSLSRVYVSRRQFCAGSVVASHGDGPRCCSLAVACLRVTMALSLSSPFTAPVPVPVSCRAVSSVLRWRWCFPLLRCVDPLAVYCTVHRHARASCNFRSRPSV